jgi:hypothetical protein
MGFNTLRKGATVKSWIISELEEVIILGHKVPLHVRRGITALMMNPTFHATLLFFVRRSTTRSGCHYFGVFGAIQIHDINGK